MLNDAERIQDLAAKLELLDLPAESGNDGPAAHVAAYDLTEIEDQCRVVQSDTLDFPRWCAYMAYRRGNSRSRRRVSGVYPE